MIRDVESTFSRKELMASFVLATLATVTAWSAVRGGDDGHAAGALAQLGGALAALAVALTPKLLFERVSLASLRERPPITSWTAVVLSIFSTACLVLAAFEWLVRP